MRTIYGGEISPDDDSIAVHACHSPLRELEVLRDQLLRLFERDPTLLPHQVVVMTPELDRYAPLVHAVFDVDPDQPGYIPYRVVDRSRRATSSVVDLVLGLLALGRGRMTASSVVDLLHADPIRRRFGLPEEAVPTLLGWIGDSGVRWGVDAEDRSLAGQPPEDENTWHFGLSRLLLGYATGEGSERLVRGRAAGQRRGGRRGRVAGRVGGAMLGALHWRRELGTPRSPASWRDSVAALCAALLRRARCVPLGARARARSSRRLCPECEIGRNSHGPSGSTGWSGHSASGSGPSGLVMTFWRAA